MMPPPFDPTASVQNPVSWVHSGVTPAWFVDNPPPHADGLLAPGSSGGCHDIGRRANETDWHGQHYASPSPSSSVRAMLPNRMDHLVYGGDDPSCAPMPRACGNNSNSNSAPPMHDDDPDHEAFVACGQQQQQMRMQMQVQEPHHTPPPSVAFADLNNIHLDLTLSLDSFKHNLRATLVTAINSALSIYAMNLWIGVVSNTVDSKLGAASMANRFRGVWGGVPRAVIMTMVVAAVFTFLNNVEPAIHPNRTISPADYHHARGLPRN